MEASTPRPDLRRFAVGGAQLSIKDEDCDGCDDDCRCR